MKTASTTPLKDVLMNTNYKILRYSNVKMCRNGHLACETQFPKKIVSCLGVLHGQVHLALIQTEPRALLTLPKN